MNQSSVYKYANESAQFIKKQLRSIPKVALIVGSGMSEVVPHNLIKQTISFSNIPHMPVPTFHKGAVHLAEVNGVEVLFISGRLHYYEGYSAIEISYPIRILKLLGVDTLIMTNASGGLNQEYIAGEIVLIKDHINLLPDHPLRGPNDNQFGIRFPDMANAYNRDMRQLMVSAAKKNNIKLKEGVYACFPGPSLETPAEYRFLHTIGADMVGMSTVPEVITANHCQIQTSVLSIVTNICYPPEEITPTTLEEVITIAQKSTPLLWDIISSFLVNYKA